VDTSDDGLLIPKIFIPQWSLLIIDTGVTSGEGIAYLSGASEFIPTLLWNSNSRCSIYSILCSVI